MRNRVRILVIAALVAAFVAPLQGVSARQETLSNVRGTSYSSEQFGYSFQWDTTWDVTNEILEEGYELLELDNGSSLLYVEGMATSDDPAACLVAQEDYLTSQDGVSDVMIATADDGSAMTGADDTFSYAVWDFALALDDGSTGALTQYLECDVIVPGESMLIITHITTSDGYNDEIAARTAVTSTISFGGGPAQPTEPALVPASGSSGSDLENFLTDAYTDINNYWATVYPEISGGDQYIPPADLVFYDESDMGMSTGCSPVTEDLMMNAFYCPVDQIIYIGLPLAEAEIETFGTYFAPAGTMAHEIAHHVQEQLGLAVCESSPCLDPTELTSQELEVQADCYMGAWAADAESRNLLGDFDIESVIQEQAMIGDNSEGGQLNAHGSGALRTYWFLNGYFFGAPNCFSAARATAGLVEEGTGPGSGGVTSAGNSGASTTEPVTVGMGESFSVGPYTESIDGTDAVATLDGPNGVIAADGQYLIVYFSVTVDYSQPLAFDFSSLVLTDAEMNGYSWDQEATDALLLSAMPGGSSEPIDPGTPYNLAVVFDVPADASGFVLQQSDGSYQVTLDR